MGHTGRNKKPEVLKAGLKGPSKKAGPGGYRREKNLVLSSFESWSTLCLLAWLYSSVSISCGKIFSYASSSTLHPRQ